MSFPDRLPQACFDLVASSIPAVEINRAADAHKAEHLSEVKAEIEKFPAAVDVARLRERHGAAQDALAQIASDIERTELNLKNAILQDCASECEVYRNRLRVSLNSRHIAQHELGFLAEALKDAEATMHRESEALRRRRDEEYRQRIQLELTESIEALRPILESPEARAAIARYALAFALEQREHATYTPAPRIPFSPQTPAKAAEIVV